MKLMVQSYNNGGTAYNAEAEETEIISYRINHNFNEPAEAHIILSDPAGTIAQKYNDDANDVYIGPGKVTIEDPTGTDIFFGRIMKATADTNERTVTLYCQDWLSQLDEEQITYDMREDLDGSGLRQSTLTADYADNDAHGVRVANYYLIDHAKQDNGGSFTSQDAKAKDTTADDMDLFPVSPAVNDAYYYGFDKTVAGLVFNLTTSGDWTGSMVWEYWDGDSWEDLGETDNTSNYEAAAGWYDVTWSVPGDWATTAVDGDTAYWVRSRISGFVSLTTQPKGGQVYGYRYYVYDNSNILTADAHNDQYLVYPDNMAGTNTFGTGPYADTITWHSGAYNESNSYANVWVDDNNSHQSDDDDGDWEIDYDFRVHLGHNTPTDFYVHGSISAANVVCTVYHYGTAGNAYVEVYDHTNTTWRRIGEIDRNTGRQRLSFPVPEDYIADIVDSDGEADVRFDVDHGGNRTDFDVYYLRLEVTVDTTGYSSATLINDGTTRRLDVATDFGWRTNTTRIWNEIPYCVAKPIFKHIDSGESGTLITAGDILQTITCAATIEHTSGISTRQYKDKTRLQILKDLAIQDKAEFWIPLGQPEGTPTVTWKSAWTEGSPTAITDATVNSWTMTQDYSRVFNEFNVYGMRISDRQLYSNNTDATSIAKYIATRSRTLRDAGLVAEYDTDAKGTALVAQYKDVQKILSATIAGLDSTYRLGTECSVTSSDLGLTTQAYIVDSWTYDSEKHVTAITMHPRVSTTGLQRKDWTSTERALQERRRGPVEKYIPKPDTDTVTNP